MITVIIVAITVLISLYAFNNADVMRKFIFNPYVVKTRGEYHRFITSGFLHQDHMHLIFNMITMWFFGKELEIIFAAVFGAKGPFYFVLLYILAIIISDIPSYFKYAGTPGYNSLGASGGVSAILFAFILFDPLRKLYLYFALPIPGFIFAALYVVYSYYQGKRGRDNINHTAHLVGGIFGLIFCIILFPSVVQNFIDQIAHWRIF
jgi:membrane associated rhomboid family serine protease